MRDVVVDTRESFLDRRLATERYGRDQERWKDTRHDFTEQGKGEDLRKMEY